MRVLAARRCGEAQARPWLVCSGDPRRALAAKGRAAQALLSEGAAASPVQGGVRAKRLQPRGGAAAAPRSTPSSMRAGKNGSGVRARLSGPRRCDNMRPHRCCGPESPRAQCVQCVRTPTRRTRNIHARAGPGRTGSERCQVTAMVRGRRSQFHSRGDMHPFLVFRA
eukprot:353141-Chlamydomonas_euryale.AAC.6